MYPGCYPGLGASALSGRVDANRACGCKHHLEHAGHCLNHTDFLDLIQCLLDIIQDILYILDTYREADQVWGNACLLQLLV